MGLAKCEICGDAVSKYKCPACFLKYCSVPCYRDHKAKECETKTSDISDHQKTRYQETPNIYFKEEVIEESEDTVPLAMLEKLGHSNQIVTLLENPHLQELMKHLDSSSEPGTDIHKAMQEPIFVEFADACLKVIEPQNNGNTT